MTATSGTSVIRSGLGGRNANEYMALAIIGATAFLCLVLILLWLYARIEAARARTTVPLGTGATGRGGAAANRPTILHNGTRRGRPRRVFHVIDGYRYGFWTEDVELGPLYTGESVQAPAAHGYAPEGRRTPPQQDGA